MYRLLIVDDNPWDRKGLQELLNWREMDIEIVGTCVNGKQAIEKIDELKPNIILSDIAMPIMNGIQLAERLKETHPDIKVIFLSVYNDFDFARSAIDLDIYGYVLKPVMHDELVKALKKVLCIYKNEDSHQEEKDKMIRQLNESLPLVQEQFFRELLFGNFPDLKDVTKRAEFLQLNLLKECSIQVIYMEIKEYQSQTSHISTTDKYLIPYTIKNILNSFNTQSQQIFIVQISSKEFAAIVLCKYNSEQERNSEVLDMAVEIHEQINSRLNLYTTIGISGVSSDLLGIPELFRQSVNASNTKFYGEGNPIILYDDIEVLQANSLEGKVNMEMLYKEVKLIVASGNIKDVKDFIDRYLDTSAVYKSENYIKSLTFSIINAVQIALIEADQSFKEIFDDEIIIWKKLSHFETILDVKQWIYNIFKTLQENLNSKNDNRYSKIVDDIKEIIKNRYHEQITLTEIADSLYLSPKQVNNIFKKVTGKTIFDYIIEYRMEVAKRMLKDPYEKVYLVAERVGYINKSHFCLLFKKFTGLSPTEYRNKVTL